MLLNEFLTFVYEREDIRLRRSAGESAPWTRNHILATYKFCNVNREDDRVTRWIATNIRQKYAGHPLLWFNLVVARTFNWPDTLEALGFVERFDAKRLIRACEAVRNRTGKVFTGAYIVSTNGVKKDKSTYVIEDVLKPIWGARKLVPPDRIASCALWADWLEQFNGFGGGGFMRNQVITDMKYTHHLRDADDWSNFVLAGPGTRRGLNRLFGRYLKQNWRGDSAEVALRQVRADCQRLTSMRQDILRHFIDLNNLSNCFCEWDKYERVRLGQGKPRSLFRPTA